MRRRAKYDDYLKFRVPEEWVEELEEEAYERSSPSEKVTVSDLGREAIQEVFDLEDPEA